MRFVVGAPLAVLLGGLVATAADGFNRHCLAPGQRSIATVVAFSPDGKWLAAAMASSVPKGHQVGIWDVATRGCVATLRTSGGTENHCLAFSPDGRKLAIGAEDGIWLCDAERGWPDSQPEPWWRPPAEIDEQAPRKRKPRVSGGAQVRCLAFAPDGRRLAWGNRTRTYVARIEAADNAEKLHTGELNSATFSRDGELLVLGGSVRDSQQQGGIQLWDASTFRRSQVIPLGLPGVCAAALAPSGKLVASVAAGQRSPGGMMELRLWDLSSGQTTFLARYSRFWIFPAFSPDSRTLAVPLLGRPSETLLLDVAAGTWRGRLSHPEGQGVQTVSFSPDGRYLATGLRQSDDPVWLWSMDKPESPGTK